MSKVDRILADLPDNDHRYTLRDVLESPVPHKTVAETLQYHGYDISETAIRRWRQKHI